MSSNRWNKIDELFQSALECSGDHRAALLDKACAGDEALRAEVESLLSYHGQHGGLIDSPALEEGLQILGDRDGDTFTNVRIGPYKILREIGRGGMGAVYLAIRDDDQYQKRVAIKLIKRGMDADFIIQRFRTERQILANLEHPNIARLIDGGTAADGRPYLVMEYVEGEPVGEYCEAHQLSIEERLRVFLSVCSAVQFAHQNLIVHRDIKPGNILVTSDGAPKLLDFGIAKLIDPALSESGAQTATVLHVMTPEYASPEQVRGLQITTASDVYSLGVLLYELLTGRRPYRITSKNPAEIERIICTVEPEKPSQAIADFGLRISELRNAELKTGPNGEASEPNPQSEIRNPRFLRGDLDNIVLMAMRKEPERRYVSVAQFAEDIRRHLGGLPIVAHKDTLSYRTTKFVMRHKAGVAAAALVALVLIAGVIGIVWQSRVARQQARLAMQERDRARIETAKAERINQFLQDTLGFADPGWFSASQGKGPNATIGEALDQASKRAESELADQPEVLAGVLFTIGTSYRNLAQFDLAERDLRKSLDLYRKSYGEDSVQVAGATKGVAEILALRGNYAAAEALLQSTLTIYRKHSADGSVKPLWLSGTLNDLGLLKVTTGQPAAAEPFLHDALSLTSQLTGIERTDFALALRNLGQARAAQGDLDEAPNLYRQSIDEYRKLPGRESEVATTLSYLGDVLRRKGEYAESEASLRESIDISRRLSGDNSPNMAIGMNSLADLLYLKGDYAAAEVAAKRALEIARQLLPAGHPGFAWTMTTLGLIMNKTGRSKQAESMLREALAIRERVLPKGHWQITFTKGALGECLTTQKRYEEAEPLLIESYDDLKKTQGEQSPRTLEARQRLTQLYQAWGNKEKLTNWNSSSRR